MDPIQALQVALALFVVFYVYTWYQGAQRKKAEGFPGPVDLGIGFVTNFLDALGIGSFAPTTAVFKAWKLVKDEWIPGTLNVGHTIPTITQAFIFIGAVAVDPVTLVLMIAASFVGADRGSWPRGRDATSSSAWAAPSSRALCSSPRRTSATSRARARPSASRA